MKNILKKELWERWGSKEYKAEWDGNVFGGGKGSQRFWEYLWTLDKIDRPDKIIDIGAGKDLFLYKLFLKFPQIEAIAVDPEIEDGYNQFSCNLKEFSKQRHMHERGIITCVSVLEHVENKEEFCSMLDEFQGKIIMTLELSVKQESENYVTRKELYKCLDQFKKHHVTHMKSCPMFADNSDGTWRPLGLVLED